MPGGGSLQIRDAAESFSLATPTTVTGTVDTGIGGTGAITGASFSTPTVSFAQPVLNGTVTAAVDAAFSEVVPGAATGSVDPAGNVALNLSLRVDLHIDVENGSLVGDCVASPVNLALRSTAPYDPATRRVTLAAGNFTVPAVPTTATCSELIANGVNDALAGAGHALRLTMEGDIELPPVPGDPSSTTLSASPSGGTRFGEPVTLTATVAAVDPSLPDDPGGFVEFRDGSTVLEIVDLVDGTAQLVTGAIGLGTRSLTAHYRGDTNFSPSTSAAVAYSVKATPAVTAELPGVVVVGSDPVRFDLTVENPAEGAAIANARVDVTFPHVLAGTNVEPAWTRLEVRDGAGNWNPVTLTPFDDPDTAQGTDLIEGSLGPIAGTALAPGASLVLPLRISFPSADRLGRVPVRFDLVAVDPGTGGNPDVVVSTQGSFNLVNAERVATTVSMSSGFVPPVDPPVVRQGNTIYLRGLGVSPNVGDTPTGSYSFEIDGQPVRASVTFNNGLNLEPASTVPIQFNSGNVSAATINLPSWVGIGSHLVVVKYSGDHIYQPAVRAEPFTVVPTNGTVYTCTASALLQAWRLTLQVTAQADVPRAAVAGTEISLGRFDVTLRADRGTETYNLFNNLLYANSPTEVGGERLQSLELGIGSSGEGTAVSAQFSGTRMRNPDPDNPDIIVTFAGESGGLTLAGEPGEVVPVTVDHLRLRSNGPNSTYDVECTPSGDPIELGRVVVAGTTLDVEAPAVARVGDLVTLNATVAPATATGVVELRDGDSIVALANVAGGRATATVTLAEGVHRLRAHFRAGVSAPSSTSPVVELVVRPAIDCGAYAEAGHGAVVRLVYMELLGRCPDPAGFAYWVGRLADGTSPAVFARTISATDEAVGMVVDDAYLTMLGRRADAPGQAFWVDRLQAGGRYDRLLADLGASDEFWSRSGSTATGFVGRVYDRLLHRTPDQAGQDYWVGRLQAGTPRGALILSLANLQEPLGVLVSDSYHEILGRGPTGAERSDGITYLRATGSRSGLYAQLIGRPDFSTRAQGFPNPED